MNVIDVFLLLGKRGVKLVRLLWGNGQFANVAAHVYSHQQYVRVPVVLPSLSPFCHFIKTLTLFQMYVNLFSFLASECSG